MPFIQTLRLMWEDSSRTGDQLVRGSFVLVFGRIAIKAVQFVRTIVLARLLFPEDIGLFALAALTLGAMDVFFQSGFYAALVHERGDPYQYLDTAWSGHIIRNAFIGTLLFLAAPFFGEFFGHPEIAPLARVLALALFIEGFQNIGVALFQREMRFNRKFLLDISTVIVEVVVVIVAGFLLHNAWALVLGSLTNRIAVVFFSYLFHPYRPKFAPNWGHFRHLFRYSKWVSLGGVVGYLVAQGDHFGVGKLVGAEGLGYYQVAFALALLPVAELGRVLGNSLFPAFAKVEEGNRREAFTRVAQLVLAFTIPASFGIYALAPNIVEQLYGARWMPMAPIVSVLAFYALVRSFETIGAPFFMGIGKPKVTTVALFVQCITMALLLPPFIIKLSTIGAAWAMLASGAVSALVYIVAMYREKLFAFGGISRLVLAPLLAASGMAYALKFLESVFPTDSLVGLLFAIGLGATAYFALLWCCDRLRGGEIFAHIAWVRARVFPVTPK